MRKTMFFKNFVILFMAIGLFTSVGCSKQNDSGEVDSLRAEVNALRADLSKDFDAKIDAKVKGLQQQLDDAKKKLDELSKKEGVTRAELDAAKQEVLNATVTKVAFDEYKNSVKSKIDNAATAADLETLKKKVDAVEPRVAALETLVGENKAALDSALEGLKTEFDGKLNAEVEALKASIAENKTALEAMLAEYKTATDAEITKLNERLAALEAEMNVKVVSGMLNSRLTSLVLLPEYVSDNGGALPILYFMPLYANAECGYLTPSVEVKYVVSPSSVTASDIDTKNLTFKYNDPKVTGRPSQETAKPEATFVSLENGILTVKASINLSETWATAATNPENRIDQLMLQVPLAGENSGVVVSSDWAKVKYKSTTAAVVKTPRKNDTDSWKFYELKSTVADAKAINVNDDTQNQTVVKMAWDQELDLNTVVKSLYRNNWTDLNLSQYDLAFAFDLKDENGKVIEYNLGVNNTNQQKFIKLHDDGYTVSTKVYDKNGNEAAIGRTPIVHVVLKKGDCIVKHGFIKLQIIEREIPEVDPIVYEAAADYEAKCDRQVLYEVGTQQMNEDFYHAVNMSKEDFHAKYRLENVNETGNVGAVYHYGDYYGSTTSRNLVYVLTEDEVWNNVGKTVWKKAQFVDRSTNKPVIEIKFKVAIVAPTVNLDVLLDNYWFNGFTNIIHNVAIPNDGATNSDNATYANNINNAFVTVEGTKLLNLNNKNGNKYDGYTYEYIFDITKNQPIKEVSGHTNGKITISVSADGKELKATQGTTTETVARINPQSTDGDILAYNEGSELGKWLLNNGPEFMKARVVLVVKNNCTTPRRVNVEVKNLADKDRFNVHFLRPINVKDKSGKNFIDGVDFGAEGSFLNIKDVAELSDWRNRVKNTDKYNFLPNNENYYSYYGVENIKVNTAGIKVDGLTSGGTPTTTLPETIKINQTGNGTNYEGQADANFKYGTLTYKNNGNNLDKPFTLIVPVTVEYKWGKIETTVRVEVKPTSKTARKAVK